MEKLSSMDGWQWTWAVGLCLVIRRQDGALSGAPHACMCPGPVVFLFVVVGNHSMCCNGIHAHGFGECSICIRLTVAHAYVARLGRILYTSTTKGALSQCCLISSSILYKCATEIDYYSTRGSLARGRAGTNHLVKVNAC
jgi:hypothetical protein